MDISSKLNAALKRRLQSSVPPGRNLAESQLCKGAHLCVCVCLFVPQTLKVCKMPDNGSAMNISSISLPVMLVGIV
jgi:hypothetical protein